MFSKYFYVKGYNGKLVRNLISEDEFDIEDKIIEFDPRKMIPNERCIATDYYSEKMSLDFLSNFWNKLEEKYCKWAKFGKFGDIIFIKREAEQAGFFSRDLIYDIVFIGWLEHKKTNFSL